MPNKYICICILENVNAWTNPRWFNIKVLSIVCRVCLHMYTICQESSTRETQGWSRRQITAVGNTFKYLDNNNWKEKTVLINDMPNVFHSLWNIAEETCCLHRVKDSELEWLRSYLSNHIQRVNYKGTISDEQSVTIGMSQGIILGPLLFIIFMNDTYDAIKQMFDLYADDTTLQASDQALSVLEQNLNDDLISLTEWLNEIRPILNTNKIVCMILSTHQHRSTVTHCTLHLKVGNKPIKTSKSD